LIDIDDSAIFVADVHYRLEDECFIDYLDNLETKQLFLCGDIFDLLIGDFNFLVDYNKKLIDKILSLSLKMDIIYLEGNHDFLIDRVFGNNIRVVPLEKQPLLCRYKSKIVSISHGDVYNSNNYALYTKFIRNRVILNLLNFITLNIINNWLLKYQLKQIKNKNRCKDIDNFKLFIETRMNYDITIEGHYHQNIVYNYNNRLYLSIPPFVCSRLVLKLSDLDLMTI
jgi:UDP-2,3-diacylglucosamine hydrolase